MIDSFDPTPASVPTWRLSRTTKAKARIDFTRSYKMNVGMSDSPPESITTSHALFERSSDAAFFITVVEGDTFKKSGSLREAQEDAVDDEDSRRDF
uniref:FHA domain-containing protein n=1 Tax=Romanomermis culicivorax TaxID=13658 RepID=A0A915IPZ5_ROMCU